MVPAGIFYPDKTCLIGNGVAIDPRVLLEEIDSLEARDVSTRNLYVSDRAHVVMPYHPLIDQLDEKLRGDAAIGTTGRGIGPCFTDKVARLGIRMGDLVDPVSFRERLSLSCHTRTRCSRASTRRPLDIDQVCQEYGVFAERLAHRVCDLRR